MNCDHIFFMGIKFIFHIVLCPIVHILFFRLLVNTKVFKDENMSFKKKLTPVWKIIATHRYFLKEGKIYCFVHSPF